MNIKLKYSLVFLIVISIPINGQNYDTLVKQKENLIKESEILNQILRETKTTHTNTLEKLNIINTKIKVQTSLLGVYNQTIKALKLEQSSVENKIITISNNLEKLKRNYVELIQISHRSIKGHNRLLFFLAAQNFNQLIRRLYHFKQIEIDRRKKHKEIQRTQHEYNHQKELVITKKAEQAELALIKKAELKTLNKTKQNQESTIQFLITKKDSLARIIKLKNLETEKITKIILDFLESEKKKETNLTPELKLLSSSFNSNKGRLPWPVNQGSIVNKFGKVPHPILSGITLMNNGIEIATNNHKVRAIFDGEVSKIIVLPTGFKVVIIKHGEYLTVYSHLYTTTIQKGEKVKTNDHIGSLQEEDNTKNNLLGFQIWKGREKLNPTHWISSD